MSQLNTLRLDAMVWLASSPGSASIENTCDLLGQVTGKRFSTTKEAVNGAIQLELGRLTTPDCARVCQSVRERFQAVTFIDANGSPTRR
jgi:hypothetical protein